MEAKIAAEANPFVGKNTLLEVRTSEEISITTRDYQNSLRRLVERKRLLPNVPDPVYGKTGKTNPKKARPK
jgi:hypothetical protein